jgi:hypothetical protein
VRVIYLAVDVIRHGFAASSPFGEALFVSGDPPAVPTSQIFISCYFLAIFSGPPSAQ